MTRTLSHSEISTLLDCPAAHDYGYVGQVVPGGGALAPKHVPVLLREGRAWGAGVAAWHASGDVMEGRAALVAALADDAREQCEHGLYSRDEHDEVEGRLIAMLAGYARETERLPLERLEHELCVAIPSRTGRRRSSTYRLQCFFDGIHVDARQRVWIVEFKLRGQLSSAELIARQRQTRWYAWAWREEHGVQPAGVIVDERWRELPKPARILKSGRASHALDQLTTPDLYLQACTETGTDPDPAALAAYRARRWQQRVPILFRPDELDDVGRQLVSAARLVQLYDSGALHPIPNPSRSRCPGCRYRDICPDPSSAELVDALFTRVPAKRDRPLEVA